MTHHVRQWRARLTVVAAAVVTAAAALAGASSTGGAGLTKASPVDSRSASPVDSRSDSPAGRRSAGSGDRADGPFRGGAWTARLLGPEDSLAEDSLTDVSCGAPGDCTVGGSTRDPLIPDGTGGQAFLVSEVNGAWQQAMLVPGLAAVNKGKAAGVTSVSCASQGNCTAIGYYSPAATQDGGDKAGTFAVSEVRGTWQQAVVLKGGHSLQHFGLLSVSCASAGNCTAAGQDSGGYSGELIAVNEINGIWQQVTQIAGQDARPFKSGNPGLAEELTDSSELVTCASPGDCIAGATFGNERTGPFLSFAASEINGIWQQGEVVPPIPDTAQEHAYGAAPEGSTEVGLVDSISCTSAGNCTASGTGSGRAMVVNELNGIWQHPIYVPGAGGQTTSVSCSSPGNCTAGGSTGVGTTKAFVVSEVNGAWQQPMQIPGLDALAGRSTYNQGLITSVSCSSPGNCAATGTYGIEQVFLASQINGIWQQAVPLPGQATAEADGGAQDPDSYSYPGSAAAVSCPASNPPAPSGALWCAGFANLGSHLGSNLVFSEAAPSAS